MFVSVIRRQLTVSGLRQLTDMASEGILAGKKAAAVAAIDNHVMVNKQTTFKT